MKIGFPFFDLGSRPVKAPIKVSIVEPTHAATGCNAKAKLHASGHEQAHAGTGCNAKAKLHASAKEKAYAADKSSTPV